MEVLTLYLYTRGAARTLSGSTQIDFIGKSDTCSQLARRVKRRISESTPSTERETSAATVTLDVSEATVSGEKAALAVMATRPRWK